MKPKPAVSLVFMAITFCILSGLMAQNQKPMLKMQSEVKGEGKPLVLVGGGLTGWKSWEPFVELFTAKQRKVVRVQLISVQYGLEGRPLPEDYSVRIESEALGATLDSLGLTGPVDIMAWSFGALTSLNFALDHPARIRSLTMIEPPALWVLRETGQFGEDAREAADFFQQFRNDISEDMLAEFLRHAGFVPPGQSARDLPQWPGWVPFRQSLRNNPFAVEHNDSLQRLTRLQAPVLLIKGAGSTSWLRNSIDALSKHLPHATVAEFAGGHAAHIVSRDRFIQAWEKFQREVR